MDKNPFKLNNLLKDQNSIAKFVINFTSSDSESEDEEANLIDSNSLNSDLAASNDNLKNSQMPTTELNKDNNNNLNENQTNSTSNRKEEIDKNVAYKIQASAIKNMLIDKTKANNLKIRLQETDQHSTRLKKLINKKNLNIQQMKSKIVQNQLKLRKQQAQVKKLQLLYLNSSKEMKNNMKEISLLNNSLGVIQKGMDSDKRLMIALETKSKNLINLIETNLKENDDNQIAIELNDKQQNRLLTTNDQENDNMSLASSDEQHLNLILEHNDTSLNRQDCLFVQQSTELTINRNRNSKSANSLTETLSQIQAIPIRLNGSSPTELSQSKNNQNLSNLIAVPIIKRNNDGVSNTLTSKTTNTVSSNSALDENSISKIIDLKLDYSRKSSSSLFKKTPIKLATSSTNRVLGIHSPTIKKRPMNKKKNDLLKKMLMIEERNEKDELERLKKEESNKKKLMNEKREKDISELRIMLKNKQILSNALINLKKDIRNLLKLNDKIENYDLFVNGLTLFLENSLDKSYLLDDLTIKIDNKLFDKDLKKRYQTAKSTAACCSGYSNNLMQPSSNHLKEVNLNQEGSVLESIRAYRLSNNFEEKYIKKNGQNFTLIVDSFFANKVNPYSTTCNFDLNGKCNDDNCSAQHKKDFLLDQRQKVIDLLLYNPSITRYKGKVETNEDMNGLLKHLNEFIENLEKKYSYNEMIKYLVKLIRVTDDESIIIKTKVQTQQTENTTINEYISNQSQQTGKENNTFSDYAYNFKIRDRNNVLTYSKLINSNKSTENHQAVTTTQNNYENSNQQRFFNLNNAGTNSLEEYCKENPTDVKGWIKLAYLQINSVNCRRSFKKQQLQNAIKTVVKALNLNRTSCELWQTYLYLLVNLLNLKRTDENLEKIEKQLQFICKKIIEHYPSYEIWKSYLALNLNYLNKQLISSEILDEIQSNNIVYYDSNNNRNEELISNAYLEMILYKVNLYIEINKHEKAKTYLASILSSTIQSINVSDANEFVKTLFDDKKNSNLFEDRKKYQETALLMINEDKVFLWLNYLYLIHHNRLPNEKFELFKQGFSSLIDKKPFLIAFNPVKKSNLDKLLGILIEAIKDCFFNIGSSFMDYHKRARKQIKQQMQQQTLITCLPLFHNLANLYYSLNKKKTASLVFSSLATEANQILLPLLINKAIFEEKNNYPNEAFYTLGKNE